MLVKCISEWRELTVKLESERYVGIFLFITCSVHCNKNTAILVDGLQVFIVFVLTVGIIKTGLVSFRKTEGIRHSYRILVNDMLPPNFLNVYCACLHLQSKVFNVIFWNDFYLSEKSQE